MSEKRVNIKITASTSDFDKAIKKAQSQIEKLTKTIEDMGDGKFGEKLEKQLEAVADSADKMQKSLKEMQDTLDDVNKSKMNKLEDGLDDATDATKDLNKELEDTTDSLDDLNKSKMNKLEQQLEDTKKSTEKFDEKLEDVIDSLKDMDNVDVDNVKKSFENIVDVSQDIKKRIDDLLDNFEDLDSQDLNRLEKEFDQIETAIRGMGDEIKTASKDLNNYIENIVEEVDDLDKVIDDVDGEGFDRLQETIQDLDKYIDEMTESSKDFNKEAGNIDNSELEKYADIMKDITGADGGINIDTDSSKGKNNLLDNVSDSLMSGAVAGKIMANSLDKVVDRLDDVNDKMEHLQDVADNDIDKSIDELGEEYKEAQISLEKLTDEYDDLIKKQKELDSNKADLTSRNEQYKKEIQPLLEQYDKAQAAVKDLRERLEEEMEVTKLYNQAKEETGQKLLEVNEAIEKQTKVVDDLANATDDARDNWLNCGVALDDLEESYEQLFIAIEKAKEAGNNDFADNLEKQWRNVSQALAETKEEYDKFEKALKDADDKWTEENNKLQALKEEKQLYSETARELEEYGKNIAMTEERYKKLNKQVEEYEKRAEDLAKTVKKFTDLDITQDEELEKLKKEMQETEEAAESLADDIEDISNKMAEANKVAQGYADEFDSQYKAYEKLSKRVKAYLEDEDKGILLREKVAKSFQQVANAMEGVYADSSMLNNADLVNKTLKEAAEYIKDLNLVSTENLQADLKRLGEVLEDKTEKIKRFKELNKDFGSDASNQAYGLEKQAQAIRDWANSADFAIEAADTLTHAWGDLSAAGEDHLKIRERSKYIEDYGKALEENIVHIKNYYHELETLDQIYQECTDKQRATIDDYKIWEKNKDKLLEYNRAINEYLRTIKDTGGQIDDKFLNELGNFDAQKFIDNFEKMGASSVVLSKQINAVKIELLESIKQYKENAEAARENAEQSVRNAEAALEEAKANQKNADSQEEYLEATEKVKKAQQDLAEAREKLKNSDKDSLETLKDQIKEYNRLAEAMREIGMAANDLGKEDISKFNKSLASMLDNIGTFDNDLPKTFADLKEDIKAVFMEMDSFDFGGVFDGLKDIGAGLFAAIPTELKVALGVAAGIGVALKESAEMGIEHFGRGADTIKNALSGIVGIARNIGQEIRDAFENITGMHMDFSSLMEIPVNFESQMAKVGAIAGATGEEFEKLEEEARKLGATTRYSATEVAEAMEYMAMAGWDYSDIMRESADGVTALQSVLNLATVASMDLGQASDFVTDGLTALGYEASDAAKFVDILAAASTSSNTSVAQMQRAFTNCAPVAGTLGITMEDLSIALGLMADKGVKGAKAGTALKNLMANMSAPTEKQLAYMKKFNLEAAQQDIVNGNLIEGLKKFKSALAGLTPQQQNAIITTIAGKEALSGISALLNTTEEDLAELESAIKNCDGAAKEMADNFDDTVKGALLGLSSAMQERLLQIFDKTKDSIKEVTKQLTEFFNIWNGLSTENGSGLAAALEYLEKVSEGWGQAIAENLEKAIGSIDNFINGGSLDSLLQVGTNIINGIAKGIQNAADNGTLDSAISGAIGKIATWFSENLDTIVDVGKEVIDAISKGISENGDAIGECIKEVMEMQTEIDKAIAHEKWKLIGENLVTFILEGLWSKVSVFWSGLTGFLESGITEAFGFIADWMVEGVGALFFDPIAALGKWIGEQLRDAIINNIEGTFNIDLGWTEWLTDPLGKAFGNKDKKTSSGSSKGSTGKAPTVDTSKSPIDIINSNLSSGKVKTDTTAAEIGQGISDNITSKLETMDAQALNELNVEMKNLQKTVNELGAGMATAFTAIQDSARTSFTGLTNIVRNQLVNITNIMRNQMVNSANIVRNQCINMTNIFRNQFVNMANIVRNQMLNVSNIIRNQAVNWANIIRNQVTNARNAFTQQMMSMAAVARTQMVNVSNIIRNQATTWANIIRNQAKNARDAFTSQMISMAKVASTQMGKVVSSVRSSMSQVASATSKGISVNVNRTGSISYTGGASALSANALYAANNASTSSLSGNIGAYSSNSYAMSTGGSGSAFGGSRVANDNVTLEIPVILDGRELARASAKYVDNELKLMSKRENRKRGAK